MGLTLVTPLRCVASMLAFDDDHSVASVPWGCFWMTPEDTRNTHTAEIGEQKQCCNLLNLLSIIHHDHVFVDWSMSVGDGVITHPGQLDTKTRLSI